MGGCPGPERPRETSGREAAWTGRGTQEAMREAASTALRALGWTPAFRRGGSVTQEWGFGPSRQGVVASELSETRRWCG